MGGVMIYYYMRINSQEDGDETRFYRQERVLRDYAEENGLPFEVGDNESSGNIFKDSCPGDSFRREGWHSLECCLRRGDTIIMKEVSRFTTDADDGQYTYMIMYEMGVRLVFVENPTINTDYIEDLIGKTERIRGLHIPEPDIMMPVLIYAAIDRVLCERAMFQQKVVEGMDASEKRPGRPKHGFEKLTPELRAEIVKNLNGTGNKDRYQLMAEYDVSVNTLSSYFRHVKKEMIKEELQKMQDSNKERKGE
jgi:DNA invertase Pin-like site-specific DNA recombinase